MKSIPELSDISERTVESHHVAIGPPPLVSIVIATYRRYNLLCDTIQHVLNNDYPLFEVIVVDQSEPDQRMEGYLANLGTKITYVRLQTPNLPAARNVGIQHSKGEIVLFCDDDIIPAPDWIGCHVRHYLDPNVAAVGGGETVPQSSTVDMSRRRASWKRPLFKLVVLWQDALQALTGAPITGRIGSHIVAQFTPSGAILADWTVPGYARVDFAKGCNMSFRRGVFDKVGLFDECCAGREETDLFVRMKKAGLQVFYDSAATVIHLKEEVGGTWHRLPNPKAHYHWIFYYESYFFFKNFPWLRCPAFFIRMLPDVVRGYRRLGFGVLPVFWKSLREALSVARQWKKNH